VCTFVEIYKVTASQLQGTYKRKWNEFWNSWVEDNIQQSDLAGYPPQTWRHFIDALYKNLIEDHKSLLSPEKIVL
jgi:hypothetical protein